MRMGFVLFEIALGVSILRWQAMGALRVDIFLSQIQMTYRCYEGTKTAYCSLGKDMQPLRELS